MKYVIGLDFGSLSGRAVLVEAGTGREVACAVEDYSHGVMSDALPDGTPLPHDYALQHPQDYLDVLAKTVPRVLREAAVAPEDVAGVGLDFTACTLLPVDASLTPLCCRPEYASRPHAYVKLWKHHAAQPYADRLNAVAGMRGEAFLPLYGGKISCEWAIPKIWQILEEDEPLYREVHRFFEAGDWVVSWLCGKESHSRPFAGYKAIYTDAGYPSPSFFEALDPCLKDIVGTRLSAILSELGTPAGGLCGRAAELTGLCRGTPVAVANIDAHAAMPAVGACDCGTMLMIMGTSTCHIMNGEVRRPVPGMCGMVKGGAVPGRYGYEAGQSCVGDLFAWFTEHCVPSAYRSEAEARGENLHTLLRRKAGRLRPGESGLLALDWWNGNRSVLVDADLGGMVLGLTLATRPEEIYRALMEATAFGTRVIIEAFGESGLPVERLIASGGIARKDPLMMQIYADVTGREIRIAGSAQSPALGSAIFAACAAGLYPDVPAASAVMGRLDARIYRPEPANTGIYSLLYREYKTLHDYFGRGENDVMKRLRALRSRLTQERTATE